MNGSTPLNGPSDFPNQNIGSITIFVRIVKTVLWESKAPFVNKGSSLIFRPKAVLRAKTDKPRLVITATALYFRPFA